MARGEQSATFAMPSSGTGEAIQKDGVTYYTPPKAKVWAHCRCGYAASSADDFSTHFHEVHVDAVEPVQVKAVITADVLQSWATSSTMLADSSDNFGIFGITFGELADKINLYISEQQ